MTFVWVLDESKFLNIDEIKKLRIYCKKQITKKARLKLNIRDWFLIELLLNTGLRVQEVADLKCGDLLIKKNQSSIVVRHGKGGRKRIVRINTKFKQACIFYLKWKYNHNEYTNENAPLFCNKKGKHLSKRTFQSDFKKLVLKAGLPVHYSIHSVRHTYASFLLRASRNIRLIQKQLGHSRITTTEVYADVMNEELEKALGHLYEDSY
ncbi:MAG: tyrosine-type recombinase/integrase [Candidatus Aureabacteria bacterium]|nr:tyrosine-type recombinase/integrase [Candidatus Auribacterota bacterium]